MIEAAPERLELKRELFAKLSAEIVPEDCVLASNTSSLLVTEIATAARRPDLWARRAGQKAAPRRTKNTTDG